MSISDHDNQPHCDDRRDRPDTGERIEMFSLRGPGDMVSVIPYLLGFRPGDGDVAIVFTQQGLQVCVSVARISDPSQLHAMWTSTVAMVTRPAPGIDGAYLVAYLGPDADTALQELSARATPPLTDVFRVQAGRVWSLAHRPPGVHTPPEGMVVPTGTPRFATVFAASGAGDLPDRAGLRDCLRPGPPAMITEAATHLEALMAADRPGNNGTSTDLAELVDLLASEHEARIDGPVPLTSERAALLLFALQKPEVRDTCVPGFDDAAWWLWSELIRHAPPGWVAPVAALIATTAFQQGRTTQARIAAGHALADAPGSPLARIVAVTVSIHNAPSTVLGAVLPRTAISLGVDDYGIAGFPLTDLYEAAGLTAESLYARIAKELP